MRKAIKLRPLYKTAGFQDAQTVDEGVLHVPPMEQPGGQQVNPVELGMQMGVVGAAAGIGLASIRRAIRLRAGDQTPVSAVKPMMVGALIGAALGTAGGYKARKNVAQAQPQPVPQSWPDMAGKLQMDVAQNLGPKFAGLRHITVKRAQLGEVATSLAKIPLYNVPVLGAGMFGVDTVHDIGDTIRDYRAGNYKGAIGSGLSAVGNAAGTVAGLFGLGGVARGIKGIAGISRFARLGKGTPEAINAANWAGGKLAPLWKRLSPAMGHIEGVAKPMESIENTLHPYKKYKNWMFGSGILTGPAKQMLGGGMAAGPGMPDSGMPSYSAPRSYDRRGLQLPDSFSNAIPQFGVPNVNF